MENDFLQSSLPYFTDLLYFYIKSGFENGPHLTGNLTDTMKKNGLDIYIPAEKYNMKEFMIYDVISYTGKGSYANLLNEEGSWIMRPISDKKPYRHVIGVSSSSSRRNFYDPGRGFRWVHLGNHRNFVYSSALMAAKRYCEHYGLELVEVTI